MFERTLSHNARNALAVLGERKLVDFAYLAGGTAAALQLGHRKSEDLDFFTPKKFDADLLAEKLRKTLSGFLAEKVSWRTIIAKIEKTKFSIFFYKYPVLFPAKDFLGVHILDLRDLAAMKIAAIADRGTKRDFVDLYFLFKDEVVTLGECFDLYDRKYKALIQNKFHILKSLIYFKDADSQRMPPMLRNVTWREVKTFLEEEVKKLV